MRDGMTEYTDGTRHWYKNDELHRTDGPAVERANGEQEWYVLGARHRTDGPAIEHPDGYRWWCLHGVFYTFKEWLEVNTKLTPKQKIMLMIKYGDE